jgi:hypothetical protein
MLVVKQFSPTTLSLREDPSDRRLDVPQSRSGRCREEKNLDPAGNVTPEVNPIARCYTV